MTPVSWSEIKAWQDITMNTGQWIGVTMRNLSISYVEEYNRSNNEVTFSPYQDAIDKQSQREAVSRQFRESRNRRMKK